MEEAEGGLDFRSRRSLGGALSTWLEPVLGQLGGFKGFGIGDRAKVFWEVCSVPVYFPALLHGNGLGPRGISVGLRPTATEEGLKISMQEVE